MGTLAPRAQSVNFLTIGASVEGTVTKPYEDMPQTEMGTDRPKLDKNGRPMTMPVIELQTTLREDADDDGVRLIYLSWVNAQIKTRNAIKESGAADLEVGAFLKITYVSDEPSRTPGFNPSKQFEVIYRRPTGTLGATSAPPAQQSYPAPAQQYSPPPNTLVDAARAAQQQAAQPPPVSVPAAPVPTAGSIDPAADLAKVAELVKYNVPEAIIQQTLPHLSKEAVAALISMIRAQ